MIQEAERAPNKLISNEHPPRHIIIKLTKFKDKERILKAARETHRINYKRNFVRLSGDFSTETPQARRKWQNILMF